MLCEPLRSLGGGKAGHIEADRDKRAGQQQVDHIRAGDHQHQAGQWSRELPRLLMRPRIDQREG